MFSIGPLGKRVVCFGHSLRLVKVLDCSVDLLDHWSRFGSEGSDATKVLTLLMAKLKMQNKKTNLTKNHWRYRAGVSAKARVLRTPGRPGGFQKFYVIFF